MKVTASNVIIKNVVFIDGGDKYHYWAGALLWSGKNGKLDNCTFLNNKISMYNNHYAQGGAILWTGDSGAISNCKFFNNSADIGGAIDLFIGPITNCIFENNKANYEAGAVNAHGLIKNCIFLNNSCKLGSAIQVSYDGCTVSDCIFENNKGSYAYYYSTGSGAKLLNSKFINNSNHAYIGDSSSVYLKNNVFECKITIQANNITYGEVVSVKGTFDAGVNCNLDISLYEGENLISDFNFNEKHIFSSKLNNLSSGIHIIKIIAKNNTNFFTYSNNELTFTVKGLYSQIIASNIKSFYKENSYLMISLKDASNNNLANVPVNINVNDDIITLTTNQNGIVQFNTNILPVGKYTVIISFNGNYKYDKSYAISTIEIDKSSTKIEVNDLTKVYGSNGFLQITLKDKYNSILPNSKINLYINNEKITLTTNLDGKINFNVINLNAGIYIANIEFEGDNNYMSNSKSTTITINKCESNLKSNYITSKYNSNDYLTIATLKDSNKYLSDLYVDIILDNGKIYSNIKTDTNGNIKILIKDLAPDIYTAKIIFSNENYMESSAQSLIIIKKDSIKLSVAKKTFKIKVKNKKITAVLKDSKNRIIKNIKLTLKVNGKNYKATTNSKGKATFKISKLKKKGKFTATVKFTGNKYYNSGTKKVKITVKK